MGNRRKRARKHARASARPRAPLRKLQGAAVTHDAQGEPTGSAASALHGFGLVSECARHKQVHTLSARARQLTYHRHTHRLHGRHWHAAAGYVLPHDSAKVPQVCVCGVGGREGVGVWWSGGGRSGGGKLLETGRGDCIHCWPTAGWGHFHTPHAIRAPQEHAPRRAGSKRCGVCGIPTRSQPGRLTLPFPTHRSAPPPSPSTHTHRDPPPLTWPPKTRGRRRSRGTPQSCRSPKSPRP
jgi:hypothetical protein